MFWPRKCGVVVGRLLLDWIFFIVPFLNVLVKLQKLLNLSVYFIMLNN